jgi:hypothetical protein
MESIHTYFYRPKSFIKYNSTYTVLNLQTICIPMEDGQYFQTSGKVYYQQVQLQCKGIWAIRTQIYVLTFCSQNITSMYAKHNTFSSLTWQGNNLTNECPNSRKGFYALTQMDRGQKRQPRPYLETAAFKLHQSCTVFNSNNTSTESSWPSPIYSQYPHSHPWVNLLKPSGNFTYHQV